MKRLSILFILLTCLLPEERLFSQEAVVGVSAAYLRHAPDYESALETQELMGTVVKVLEKERYWVKVESPQPYTAWCTDRVLVRGERVKAWKDAPKYVVLAPVSKVLSEPKEDASQHCDLVLCDRLEMRTGRYGKPLRRGSYAAVSLPDGRAGWVSRKDLVTEGEWLAQGTPSRDALVRYARTFLGTPYLWGGMTPKGFDCSGLVRMTFLRYGFVLPRNASQMALLGRSVTVEDLQPGDLLFFGVKGKVTHVALYIGDHRFIHSSHLVRINSMRPEDPDVYENIHKFLFARNILD